MRPSARFVCVGFVLVVAACSSRSDPPPDVAAVKDAAPDVVDAPVDAPPDAVIDAQADAPPAAQDVTLDAPDGDVLAGMDVADAAPDAPDVTTDATTDTTADATAPALPSAWVGTMQTASGRCPGTVTYNSPCSTGCCTSSARVNYESTVTVEFVRGDGGAVRLVVRRSTLSGWATAGLGGEGDQRPDGQFQFPARFTLNSGAYGGTLEGTFGAHTIGRAFVMGFNGGGTLTTSASRCPLQPLSLACRWELPLP